MGQGVTEGGVGFNVDQQRMKDALAARPDLGGRAIELYWDLRSPEVGLSRAVAESVVAEWMSIRVEEG